ncbi:HAD family hydrolase [Ruminococcus sp. 5_1_39BFAA]|uniref:HAD family hydrolase n=1 Tax=Ruminococcus sp. 5_1_39BFAA TaxID=457412 RepID=UPI003565A2F7
MIKACIFDLDGTLAYTLDSMACVANEVMEKYSLKTLPVENFKYYCGNGADRLIERCLRDAGDEGLIHYEEARRIYRELFDRDPLYKVSHYPGMPETIRELRRQGVKLAVCSNKPHLAAVKVISEMFGDGEFDIVIGQSDSMRKKPAPDEPLKAAEEMGVKPEECMYFGDTGTDMQTGRAAGMYTVGVLWGYRDRAELMENGAQALLEKPEEILKLYGERKND